MASFWYTFWQGQGENCNLQDVYHAKRDAGQNKLNCTPWKSPPILAFALQLLFTIHSYDESPIPILKISVDYIKQFCNRRKGDTGSQNSKDLISSNQWVFYLKNITQGSKFKTNQCCKIRLHIFDI